MIYDQFVLYHSLNNIRATNSSVDCMAFVYISSPQYLSEYLVFYCNLLEFKSTPNYKAYIGKHIYNIHLYNCCLKV